MKEGKADVETGTPLGVEMSIPQSSNEILRPSGHSPKEIREWIDLAVQATGLTPTELARRADVAPSTINRFMSGKSKNTNISATTINKILKVITLEIDSKLEQDSGSYTGNLRGFVVPVSVIGTIDDAPPRKKPFWPRTRWYSLRIQSRWMYNTQLIGFEIEGNVADRLYIDSSIIVCRSLKEFDREPKEHENVVAIKGSSDGYSKLHVGRYFVDANGIAYINSLSSSQEYREPVLIGEKGNAVAALMLVVASIRPEPIWLPPE